MAATGKPLAKDIAAKDTALVLVGHGSTRKLFSSRTIYLHAGRIRERNIFAEVREAFLEQDPVLDDVLAEVGAPKVSPKICMVPFMASKGYITDRVMPARIAPDANVVITEPVGVHPLILQTLQAKLSTFLEAGEINAGDVMVLVVGHGTAKHRAAADQLEALAAALPTVAKAVFLEQEPLLKDWRKVTDGGTVIVLPFLMSGGLHGTRDIPALLGINRDNPGLKGLEKSENPAGPFDLRGREVYLFRPLGYEPVMTDIIIERARATARRPSGRAKDADASARRLRDN